MKQRLLLWGSLSALLAGAVLISWFMLRQPSSPQYDPALQESYLRGHYFGLEVADTPDKRARGLSGRPYVDHSYGMWFVFDAPGKHCFWMKDTLVPLDMLWFDAGYRLVHQEQSVTPDTFPNSFCPPTEALYVLEVRGGTAKALGLQLGDTLRLK